jgi:hypothetical protein
MPYRVTSTWSGNVDIVGYVLKNTVESFREMVECLPQSDFLACVDAQNVEGWQDLKDMITTVMLSPLANETLNEEEQIYTRSVDWPDKESYDSWIYLRDNLLSDDPEDYNGVNFFNIYVKKISEVGETI